MPTASASSSRRGTRRRGSGRCSMRSSARRASTEVVVVDDESSDGTAALAERHGASVVAGAPLPDGWAGKAWALQQGLEAATGEWVVFLDADTRPVAGAAGGTRRPHGRRRPRRAHGRRTLRLPDAGMRWLHPAMLTTLVYRYAPPGASRPGPVHRRMGNGQCIAARRSTLLAAGGWRPVAHHTVEDVALVRAMATAGFAVAFLDAGDLLTVRMYESAPDAWRGWGRSLSLPGRRVSAPPRRPTRRRRPRPDGTAAAAARPPRRRARRGAARRPHRHARRHRPGVRAPRPRLLAVADGRPRRDRCPRRHPFR